MRIMVTGGCGFIGSALILKLTEHSEWSVLNLDKLTYAANPQSLGSIAGNENYRFVQQDLCDSNAVERLVHDFRPDVVLHLAAESHVDRSISGSRSFVDSNIIGTHSLLEACRSYFANLSKQEQQGFRFIHVSTDEVFGELSSEAATFTEESPYRPRSPYAASKAASDHLVRAWSNTYGIPAIITNSSNIYGPRQHPEKLIPTMIVRAVSGKALPIYGDGQQIRDWLHVDDQVAGLVGVMHNGRIGESYNLGGRCERPNREVVNLVCSVLDDEAAALRPVSLTSFGDLITQVEDRPGHDRRYGIDPHKMETELGWKPAVCFEDGIRTTVRWYLDNRDWWGAFQPC